MLWLEPVWDPHKLVMKAGRLAEVPPLSGRINRPPPCPRPHSEPRCSAPASPLSVRRRVARVGTSLLDFLGLPVWGIQIPTRLEGPTLVLAGSISTGDLVLSYHMVCLTHENPPWLSLPRRDPISGRWYNRLDGDAMTAWFVVTGRQSDGTRFRSTPRSKEEAEVLMKSLRAEASDRKAKLIAKKSGNPVVSRQDRGLQSDIRIEPAAAPIERVFDVVE